MTNRSGEDDPLTAFLKADLPVVGVLGLAAWGFRMCSHCDGVAIAAAAGEAINWRGLFFTAAAENLAFLICLYMIARWHVLRQEKAARAKMEEDVDDNEEMKGVV